MRGSLTAAPAAGPSGIPASGARPGSLKRIAAQLLPPYREAQFWATQALVFAIAGVHASAEGFGLFPDALKYFVPVSLFFIPTIYAAANFGIRGSVATALWCLLITAPNWLIWHSGLERWGVLFQVSAVVLIAAFVGNRIQEQKQARTRAEEASREAEISELKYRGLFEMAGEGVLVVDRGGRIIECNSAAGELLRSSPGAVRNNELADILPPRQASALLDIVVHGDGTRDDLQFDGPDGKDIWVQPVCTPIAQGDGLSQIVLRNVTEQKRRQFGLESYAAQILRAQEEERQRIARELHDETVQSLVLLCRKLDEVKEGTAPGFAESEIDGARAYTESIVESLRGFIGGLRPLILEDLGLVPALRRLLKDLSSRSSMDVDLAVEGCNDRLSAHAELALFRIAQEALSNAGRHSGASRVRVSLSHEPRRTILVIADDGEGFSVPGVDELAHESKLGLLGMQERARIVGGRLVIGSAPGSGTEIVAEIPIS